MARAPGFTLVELLVAAVVVGILVALAVPRFGEGREPRLVAAMRSDLRDLATAEDSYYYDKAAYAPSLGLLPSFTPSPGVTVVVNLATQSGWSATASAVESPRRCVLFVGIVPPAGTAAVEGRITCE